MVGKRPTQLLGLPLTSETERECLWERWSLPTGGTAAAKVEVRLSNELPADGRRIFTSGLGDFPDREEDRDRVGVWLGWFLIVQMDKTDKQDALNLKEFNKEVTAFGKHLVFA